MTCPTCGREWCNEEKGYHCLRAAIAARDAELATLRARLEAAEGALGSALSAIEAVEEQRDAALSQVARLTRERDEARGKAPVRSMVLSVEKDGHLNLNWPTALRVDGVVAGDHVYVWATLAAKGGA